MARPIPVGLISAQAAQDILGISDTTLREYAKNHELERYGFPGSKQKPFYKEIEVRRFARRLAGKNTIVSTFEQALERDIPAIMSIDERTFPEEGAAAPLSVCVSWYRKNPHTFYVVRDEQRIVKGYASFMPMEKEFIDQFIADNLTGKDITEDMVLSYAPGKPIDIYVLAVAIDPDCGLTEKTWYGARLLDGIQDFLLSLADQGVEIATISARSHKEDGLKLLRKLNIPQLRSRVEGKTLFALDFEESGIPFVEKYRDHLEKWREKQCKQSPPLPVPTEMC